MDTLQDGLKRLKLRHLREHAEAYCEQAAKRNMTYWDFLKWIVEEEVAAREETQRTNRLRSARFPARKRMDEFDFAFQPSIPEKEVRELQTLRFVDRCENVVLLGGENPYSDFIGIRSGVGG